MCENNNNNTMQALLCHSFENISNYVQTSLSKLSGSLSQTTTNHHLPLFSLSQSKVNPSTDTTHILHKENSSPPVAKEELGRATWTFLHTLAAQYPDKPTRQQKKDVKELMAILSRMYPCKDCADHFKDVLRANPVQAGSHSEFSQWMCHVHNVVNRSLGKVIFPCERVDARWGKLECEQRACDLLGTDDKFW